MPENASLVDIPKDGFRMTSHLPERSRSIDLRISPTPAAAHGLLMMKNGQSAPRLAAKRIISLSEKMLPINPLSILSVKDASAEPPPSPAPSGMCLSRRMSNRGSLFPVWPVYAFSKASTALTTRFFSGGHAIGVPVNENSCDSASSGVISRMSENGHGDSGEPLSFPMG